MTRLQRRSPDEGLTLPAAMHPLLQRVYRQRGLNGEQELDLALANLIPPHELLGIATAVDLLPKQPITSDKASRHFRGALLILDQ